MAIDYNTVEPIELISLSGKSEKSGIILSWSTATETNNLGFNVFRCEEEKGPFQQINSTLIPGAGTCNENRNYSYLDEHVAADKTYYYLVADLCTDGASKSHGPIKVVAVDQAPKFFSLEQNYPNPFNGQTIISYSLPQTARVLLQLFNIRGELIGTLVDQEQKTGNYSVKWFGLDENNFPVSGGLYLYRFEAGNYRKAGKMIYTK